MTPLRPGSASDGSESWVLDWATFAGERWRQRWQQIGVGAEDAKDSSRFDALALVDEFGIDSAMSHLEPRRQLGTQ
jgi:hypothetical protein